MFIIQQMTNKILTIVLLTFGWLNLLQAQQTEVLLKGEYLPSKTYESLSKTTTITTMKMTSDDPKFKEFIKEKYKGKPIVSNSESINESVIKTAAMENGKLFYVTEFTKSATTQDLEGETKTTPSEIEGARVYGHYDDKKQNVIDSIVKKDMKAETRKMIGDMQKQVHDNIKYPEKPMKIGESFKNDVPFDIPMGEAGTMKMATTVIYTLKKIKDDKAFFDIKTTVTMLSELKDIKMTASGGGTGKMEYDIPNKICALYDSDTTMNMDMDMKVMKTKAKVQAKTIVTIKIK